MKLYKEIEPTIFNKTLKETMDFMGLQGAELAEETGRSRNSISRIRNGKDFPSIQELAKLLNAAEKRVPGFFDEFARRLSGKARRMTASPEEFVNSLDSSEFGALMFACASRVSSESRSEHHERGYDLVAS